jgi:hypothetical protein
MLIAPPNTKLPRVPHIQIRNPTVPLLSDHAQQALPDIADLVVLVQERDVRFYRLDRVGGPGRG